MKNREPLHFFQRNLLGIPIYDTKRNDLIYVLKDKIDRGETNIVFGISAAAFGRLKFRRDLYGIYQKMDIIIAEGAGLPLFAKSFGVTITEKIGLVNVVYDLLELANKKEYRVLFFGATDEVNKEAQHKIQKKYPNIKMCQGINGYFNEEDLPSIVKKINEETPDILLVGISYPIKERFAVKYKDYLNTKLIVPCGGAFDVIGGKVKKTSELSKRIPTAWFIRFIQEPKRLFKDIIITVVFSLFWLYPRLLFQHIFIRKNPSVAAYFKLNEKEWDSGNGSVKG